MIYPLYIKRRQIRDYSPRSLRGLASCATKNIAIYCAAPVKTGQLWDDARCEHLTFNIGNRAMLRAELRRRKTWR